MNEKIHRLETELATIKTVPVTVTETDDNDNSDSSIPEEVISEVRVKLVKPPRQVGHLHKEILTGSSIVCFRQTLNFPLVRSGERPL